MMSHLSCMVGMGGIRELLDGKKMGMGFKFQMGMGMKSLKWEGIGTKNLFPHTSNTHTHTPEREREDCSLVLDWTTVN